MKGFFARLAGCLVVMVAITASAIAMPPPAPEPKFEVPTTAQDMAGLATPKGYNPQVRQELQLNTSKTTSMPDPAPAGSLFYGPNQEHMSNAPMNEVINTGGVTHHKNMVYDGNQIKHADH